MSFDDFQKKLVALETLAEGRILINLEQREIVLRQEPRMIIEQIEATLDVPALDTKLLDVGQIKVLQLADSKDPGHNQRGTPSKGKTLTKPHLVREAKCYSRMRA